MGNWESLYNVIQKYNLPMNSGIRNFIYETFDKEKEADDFVAYMKRKNKLDASYRKCEIEFEYLCGAYDRENPNREEDQ